MENDLRRWYEDECISELVGYRAAGGADSFEDAEALLTSVRLRARDRLMGRINTALDLDTHPASDLIRLLAEGVIASQGDV